jgi:L-alanine-DL-glutamate epimerase-like enolase superfamily enzyme
MTSDLPEQSRVRITALKAMELKDSAGQSLVKVETDAGLEGYGEAGASGPVVRAHLKDMEPVLLDEDPLSVERLYDTMASSQHTYRAHIPTVSGVDIALWDLAGKILNRSVSTLITGRYRDEVPLYYTDNPPDMLDQAVYQDWVDTIKAHPDGYRTLKFGFEPLCGQGVHVFKGAVPSQTLTAMEIEVIRKGFENIRAAMGGDMDLIIHCHNEWDLPSMITLSEALASVHPLWLEDPLPVWYSDSWKSLKQASGIRICTGEKLEAIREFLPFILNNAIDAVHPDLAFAGGITGCRRIAALADLYYIPVVTHNVGTLIQNMATAHFGASVRNFLMSETRLYERPYIRAMGEETVTVQNGNLRVPDGPGLGVTLVTEVLKANLKEGEPYWD